MADYGGGFLHQDSMGDGSSQPHGAGAGPSPPRRFRENKTLTPVTIKQLMTAKASPDDTFKIDEIEVTQVTFVALIRAVNVQPTNVNYTLDDGTGVIEAKEWKPQEETEYQVQQRQLRREGIYVRVVGQLRANKDRRNIAVHHMRPVTDYNELTFHLLEAIQAHLYFTRGGATRAAAAAGAAGAAGPMGVAAPQFGGGFGGAPVTVGAGYGGGGGSGYRPGAPAMTGNPVPSGLPPGLNLTQGRVMKAIKDCRAPEGIHVEAIAQQLGMSLGEVRKTVEFLSEEGHIFSTTDEHHYRSTDS